MAQGLSDISADIDALYKLPFAEFIPGRNALEKRVKAAQGKEAAAGVKALEKPSVSAWVVNQLYWRHRRDFDGLLRAGDELRVAQQKRMAGRDVDVNAAIDARRDALRGLMGKADDLLEETGTTSAEIRQRVETTLEALSVYGSSDAAPRAGRLTSDVQPPGFAALAALVPAGPGPSPRARPSGMASVPAPKKADADAEKAAPARPESKRVEKARAALAEAELELTDAREAAERAAAAQVKAQAEWEKARDALEAIQEQLDAAMDREKAAQVERDERRKAATQATQAAGRAERARNEAERYLEGLTG